MKLKILVALLVLGAIGYEVVALIGWAADSREAEVRREWAQEKLDLVAARQAAEQEAAELRRQAEDKKQENTQHGENVIEQSRNIDPDWSATRIPIELYQSARQN
jgi:hypothetical protein